MDELILRAEPRTVVGKKVKQLRRDGLVPGVIYGPGLDAESTLQVTVNRREFDKFYLAHGHSTLFTLEWEGGKQQVFIREVQEEPVKRSPLHIDFFAPNLRRELVAPVPVVLRHAADHNEGMLSQIRTEVEVSALPRNIPHEIDADVSGLVAIGDQLRVGDLTMPKGVTAVTAEDEVIALIAPERVAEPEPEVEAEGEVEAEAEEGAAAEVAPEEAATSEDGGESGESASE